MQGHWAGFIVTASGQEHQGGAPHCGRLHPISQLELGDSMPGKGLQLERPLVYWDLELAPLLLSRDQVPLSINSGTAVAGPVVSPRTPGTGPR